MMNTKSVPESAGAHLVSIRFSQTRLVTSLGAGTSEIALSNGAVVLIDAADHASLSQYKWHLLPGKKTDYAVAWIKQAGVWKHWLMHRFILNAPKGLEVDHRNRNGLDNRRENLRLATTQQNQANAVTSGQWAKGVNYVPHNSKRKPWTAKIVVNKKTIWLGQHTSEAEAAAAYDAAALKYFGEFARMNSHVTVTVAGSLTSGR